MVAHILETLSVLIFSASINTFSSIKQRVEVFLHARRVHSRIIVWIVTGTLCVLPSISLVELGKTIFGYRHIFDPACSREDYYSDKERQGREGLENYIDACKTSQSEYYRRAQARLREIDAQEAAERERQQRERSLAAYARIRACINEKPCSSSVCLNDDRDIDSQSRDILSTLAAELRKSEKCTAATPDPCSVDSFRQALQTESIPSLGAFIEKCANPLNPNIVVAKQRIASLLRAKASVCIQNSCDFNQCLTAYNSSQYADREAAEPLKINAVRKADEDFVAAEQKGLGALQDYARSCQQAGSSPSDRVIAVIDRLAFQKAQTCMSRECSASACIERYTQDSLGLGRNGDRLESLLQSRTVPAHCRPPPPPESCAYASLPGFRQVWCGKSFYGHDIGVRPPGYYDSPRTIAHCASVCRRSRECKGFQMKTDSITCNLYRDYDENSIHDNSQYVSGIK